MVTLVQIPTQLPPLNRIYMSRLRVVSLAVLCSKKAEQLRMSFIRKVNPDNRDIHPCKSVDYNEYK